MAEEHRSTLRYRVLRYTPNLVRDEWVNVGVLLEEAEGAAPRRDARFIEEDAEIARVRRIHPGADESLLRALGADFDSRLRSPAATTDLEKLDQTLSNVLQFSPARALLAENFDDELERLYREHVARPPSRKGAIVESTREWIRTRLKQALHARGIFRKLQRGVRVDEFTQAGDPLRLEYAYRYNGTRGFLQPLALNRDSTQAKVLAYTAEQIRRKVAKAEFTAITEIEPESGNRRHEFVSRLFEAQAISIVPLQRIDRFAEELRLRLP